MADFTLWQTLNPSVQDKFPQAADASPTGDVYLTQSENRTVGGKQQDIEDLVISRFVGGVYADRMSLPGGGHGNPMMVDREGTTDYLSINYYLTNAATGKVTGHQWVRIPWVAGKTWTQSEALSYKTVTPSTTKPKKGPWYQDEVLWGDTVYRLYGCPYNAKGAVKGPSTPGLVQIIRNSQVVSEIKIAHLGRGTDGKPLRGRLEPEGISTVIIGGQPFLMVGITLGGYSNGMRHQLWVMPLTPAAGTIPINGPTYLNSRRSFTAASYARATQPPGRLARWLVLNTKTAKVIGELQPTYEITDPATGPGFGTLTLPLSQDRDQVDRLRHLTLPRRRWVAAIDENGNVIWMGPIYKAPSKNGGTITVPVIDWRSWYYRTYLRPTSTGADGSVKYTKVDQTTIMRNLLLKAPAAGLVTPALNVLPVIPSGVTRDFTGAQLDRSIGEMLDDIANRERGAEWFVYGSYAADTRQVRPMVATSYPERSFRTKPFRVQWREGVGGNCYDVQLPDPEEAFTRVWAKGDGEPPAQAIASDLAPDLKRGDDILWESVIGPLSGVTKKATAYEYAYAQIERSRRADGLIEVSMLEEVRPFSSYEAGDRCHVIVDDGWNRYDVPAARIVQRVLSGGRGVPASQRLTLDVLDAHYPDDGNDPGEGLENVG